MAFEFGAVPFVLKESSKIAHLIPDFTSFEQECYQEIGRAIERHRNNGRDKKALIRFAISEVKRRVLKNRKLRSDSYFEQCAEGETVWEPEDVSANVVGEVLLKEKIALLAQDDPRKKTILAIWSRACTKTNMLRFSYRGQNNKKMKNFLLFCCKN